MAAVRQTVEHVAELEAYKHGFVTDIVQEFAPKGLNADIVRFISAKKGEPEWMLQWRLEAFERWLAMDTPDWARLKFPPIDYQDLYYYAAPKARDGPNSLDEVDPELLADLGVARPSPELDRLQERGLLVAADGGARRAMSPVLSEAVLEQLTRADANGHSCAVNRRPPLRCDLLTSR